jgi:hypothetical protein
MKRQFKVLAGLICLAATGCVGTTVPDQLPNLTVGPHGGAAISLPRSKGFGEICLEQQLAKGKPTQARIAVYFLQPDGKTALATPPSDVAVAVAAQGEGAKRSLTVKADAKPGDPAGSARFVTDPSDLDVDDIRGEVTATLDGETIKLPFALR